MTGRLLLLFAMELATVKYENCTPCHRNLDELPMVLEHEERLMLGRCVTRLPEPHHDIRPLLKLLQNLISSKPHIHHTADVLRATGCGSPPLRWGLALPHTALHIQAHVYCANLCILVLELGKTVVLELGLRTMCSSNPSPCICFSNDSSVFTLATSTFTSAVEAQAAAGFGAASSLEAHVVARGGPPSEARNLPGRARARPTLRWRAVARR